MESLGYRKSYGTSDSASDYTDLLKAFELSRLSQWSYEILNVFSLFLRVQKERSGTDYLEYYLYGPFFGIRACHCERYPLSVIGHTEYYELSRSGLPGHEGSLYLHLGDGGVQFLFPDYPVHHFLLSVSYENGLYLLDYTTI